MKSKKKKGGPEAADADESFDYDLGFNISEAFSQDE